ncbi:nickel pincer cofactor biosynthesis protein LarC [Candidatus Woesearchaeota archaeon]|nr:nickel pincer cofactor biosynthesis protein LarC [Candidatus Woesearchaeota archaeon]
MVSIYLDCQSGISGDMFLAAMIDLGMPVSHLKKELKKISNLNNFTIQTQNVMKNGISAVKFTVKAGKQPSRHHYQIIKMIQSSKLKDCVKKTAQMIFDNLASAEGKIHATDHVHFHEVGAVDSIVDIVGAAIAVDYFGIKKILCSHIPLGRGFTVASHGKIMLPSPATAELLSGFAVRFTDIDSELTTPTGAAIIKSFADPDLSGQKYNTTYEKIGYGAGERDLDTPNILRIFLEHKQINSNQIMVLETNIDDMSPQFFEIVMDYLFKAGALDVFITNIMMKKSRPAFKLTVICNQVDHKRIAEIILKNTTSFGIRMRLEDRIVLERKIDTYKTDYGPVRIKNGMIGKKVIKRMPEYDDVKRISKKKKESPLKIFYDLMKI